MHPFRLDDVRGAPPPWPFWPVALALLGGWLILGWPWLSGRFTIPWDAKAHFQPQIQFLAASLASGESPSWAPYVFSGHPQIADPQSLIFSPPFLLLALFNGAPSLRAVDTTVLLAILAGAAAIVLYFQDRHWHWAGALVAALGFGFGAAMAWRIQHTGQVLSLSLLPIALLLLSRALDRRSAALGAATGLVSAAIVLGRDQVALLAVYLLIGYVVAHWLGAARRGEEARAMAAPLGAGAVTGLLLIAFPVLLTVLVAGDSNRPVIDLESAGRGSLHPALLLTFLTPDVFGSSGEMESYWGPPSLPWNGTGLFIAQNVGQLYIGAIPALLLFMATVTGLLWAREVRFFTLALLTMLLYALGWYTPVFPAMHATVPGVDLFRRPADAVFLIGYLSSLLAGYAAHRLLTATFPRLAHWQWTFVAAVPLGALATGYALATHFDVVAPALPPLREAAFFIALGAATLTIANWLYPLRPVVAGLLVAACLVADLAVSNGPGSATALAPEVYDVLQPTTRNETIAILKAKVAEGRSDTRRDRIELVGMGFHWPNASLTHRLENTLGYNPVRLGDYCRATGAEDHSVSTADRKLTPLFPSYRSPLASLLGLRWIAAGRPIEEADKLLKPGDLDLVARTADGYIYENKDTLPRVLFATRSVRGDFEEMLKSGHWPTSDLATTVVLEGPSAEIDSAGPPRRPGSVRIVRYRHTEIVLEAVSFDGGYVVLNDMWHPWWFAEIDGKAAELLKANVLFRAVRIAPGRHRIRFVFRPLAGALAEAKARWLGTKPATGGGRTP